MEKSQVQVARGQFRRAIYRDEKGVFWGADVYPPPGVKVARFGFRRVNRPNGTVGWRHDAVLENEAPVQRLLAWLDQLGQVGSLTFFTAYKLARLADPDAGTIRETQAHLAKLIGVNPRTLRAIIRTLCRDGHLRTDRGAVNTYTLTTKRRDEAGGADGGGLGSDQPVIQDRAVGDGWAAGQAAK
jgi:hypothetical protein